MLVRDAEGNLHIVNRKDYKDDHAYYEKLFEIRKTYMSKYSYSVISSNSSEKQNQDEHLKQCLSHDIDEENEDE
jgi:hypothetical protein